MNINLYKAYDYLINYVETSAYMNKYTKQALTWEDYHSKNPMGIIINIDAGHIAEFELDGMQFLLRPRNEVRVNIDNNIILLFKSKKVIRLYYSPSKSHGYYYIETISHKVSKLIKDNKGTISEEDININKFEADIQYWNDE